MTVIPKQDRLLYHSNGRQNQWVCGWYNRHSYRHRILYRHLQCFVMPHFLPSDLCKGITLEKLVT